MPFFIISKGHKLGVNGIYDLHLLRPLPSSPPNPQSPPSSSDSGPLISLPSSRSSRLQLPPLLPPLMAMMGRVRLKSKTIAFSISMRAGPAEVGAAKTATLLVLVNGFFNVNNEVHQER
ncbi:hypothetical protein AMTRI_Chr10g4820 [Amborella trichopoda]